MQAVIKEKCTAIHPSVEWRFRRPCSTASNDHEGEEATELEPIVFRDVHPLYAATDIRGSSVQRNLAVQADLLAQLRLALAVVEAARADPAAPGAGRARLPHRAARPSDRARDVLGRRGAVLAFLRAACRAAVRPAGRLRAGGPGRARRVPGGPRRRPRHRVPAAPGLRGERDASSARPSPRTSTPRSRRRRGCSRTTSRSRRPTASTTRSTSAASLVEDGRFDPLYLKNLRLWQLMVTCGIARSGRGRPAARCRCRSTRRT